MKVVNRLKANADFALTIKNGRYLRTNSYNIHVKKTELGYVRVGISVSKKIGNAVVRNRIKRQIRAMCDHIIDFNNSSHDVVIIVRSNFLEKSFNENKNELCETISEANIGVIE